MKPLFALVPLAVLALACNPVLESPYPPPAGACTGQTTTPPPDAPIVDLESVPFEPYRSNVMLVVDRSGSMNATGACAEGTCGTRWEQLLALGPYLSAVKPYVRLGLSVYPSPTASGLCGVDGGILVPLSQEPDIDDRILAALHSTSPGGMTPTDAALRYVADFGHLNDPTRENIVILLTDGEPNCACSSGGATCERSAAVQAVEDLRHAYDPPIKVYVIGFGDDVQSQAGQTLTAMAEAAGTARNVPGQPAYYQADTVEELVTRAYEVALDMSDPCAYELCGDADPDRLLVALDGQMIEPCAGECPEGGYDFDPAVSRVSFRGAACDALRDGSAQEVWIGTER